jgi:ribonuclease P protein component
MVLHYLPVRSEQADIPTTSRAATRAASVPAVSSTTVPPSGARAGFVVGRAVGNSVVRHRVTRRLRAVVREELHRLPPTGDLVVRARPEAATASSAVLSADLSAGLDRLLADRAPRVPAS